MKTLLLMLFLLPAVQTDKILHFKVKLLDGKENAVKNCPLTLHAADEKIARMVFTDVAGTCYFNVNTTSNIVLVARLGGCYTESLTFDDLDKKNEGDTIYAIMKMRPYTNHKPK